MSSEFERIHALRRLLPASTESLFGIGDDAAVFKGDARPQVVSVDCSVEGVHFRRDRVKPLVIGYRAAMAAMSDLAAMGASLRGLLISISMPRDIDDDYFYDLIRGIQNAASVYDASVVGGNLSAGAELSLHITVIGAAEKRVMTRAGAEPGDRIYVTGVVGAAALGLRLLLDLDLRRDKKHEAFIERWSKPQARIPEGVSICRDATAAIDISDGLAQDLLHLCNASGVGALVHTHKLPRLDQHAEVAREVGEDGLALALSGGEDYELLFTYPERAEPPIPCTNIGSIESGEELHLVDAKGEKVNILRRGYEHFL